MEKMFIIWILIGTCGTFQVKGFLGQSSEERWKASDGKNSPCPLGQFQCKGNGTLTALCVPQALMCDGKKDCPTGSDEDNCKDKHDKNFWDSIFKKRPGADDDNRTCKYDFRRERNGEEGKCHCSGTKIFCHNLILSRLDFLPRDLRFLDLSGSQVQFITGVWNNLTKLETLILSSCRLEFLQPGGFNQLTSLTTLHLTRNGLRRLAKGSFKGLGILLKLFLDFNFISSVHPESFEGLEDLHELDLRNNELNGSEGPIFSQLRSLKILNLNHNRISKLSEEYFEGLDELETLSLSNNLISQVHPSAFSTLTLLKTLYLPWNEIQGIRTGTFAHLKGLLNLNLNDNEISWVESGGLSGLESLESLNMERNPFRELKNEPRELFKNLTALNNLYFDEFWMCWWAPHVKVCSPKGDGISSFKNLLDNLVLRASVWIMGLVGFCGNIFVIVSRMILREPNKVHSFYIKNLAFADLMMGIFLLCIAIADVSFRGNFLEHQQAWRHSLFCQLAGGLCTLSSEASVLILTLITLDRYLSIAKPFAERNDRIGRAFSIVVVLWTISFLLSYAPLSGIFPSYFGRDFYAGNGLCLPLQLHNPYGAAWEYSFLLFVALNFFAFSFIVFAYAKMLSIIHSSALMLRTNQEKQDTLLAKRFALVVFTDFVCWAPIIITKLLAMAGVKIPQDVYAWLAVFALPVNSALNPIIYTLTTKQFKQQLGKLGQGVRKRLRGGNLDDSSASLSFLYRNRTRRQTMTTSLNQSIRNRLSIGSRKGSAPNQVNLPMNIFNKPLQPISNTNSEVIVGVLSPLVCPSNPNVNNFTNPRRNSNVNVEIHPDFVKYEAENNEIKHEML